MNSNRLPSGSRTYRLVPLAAPPSRRSLYYAKKQGRPSIPPGVYFRMLLIGYFERIDSERGICWRCSDSLSLRQFLGLGMEERTTDHSSLSRIRNRLPLEVHESVFGWVLEVLASRGMIDGKTLGVDATTLEANAALRSIVRRDTGESYESYLQELARKSGIEEPSRADIAKLDKKRPKKGSNKEWVNPNEPDAEIMKMKSGGTDMAHKAEHAVLAPPAPGTVDVVGTPSPRRIRMRLTLRDSPRVDTPRLSARWLSALPRTSRR